MKLTRDQLTRLTAILAPYRGEKLSRPIVELALRIEKAEQLEAHTLETANRSAGGAV